ncbi:MAG: alpha/beta hydrolase-fold protein [Fuerstiella sp.]
MKNIFLANLAIVSVCGLFIMPEAIAQQFRSPEVHADRSVTLRFRSQSADVVKVSVAGQNLDLVKGDGHVWEATTKPLPAGIHDYMFDVDGTKVLDPSNRNVKKWFTLASMVEVPGTPPLLTEFQEVPHGVVQRLIYPSQTVGHSRPVIVYTPPDYDAKSDKTYPLVILMHGFGDDETAWTEVGRAHLIADNLLAQNKISGCVIAMPFGHPVLPPFGKRPENYFVENNDLYEQDLTKDLLPFLESRFNVRTDAASRSIVGLSMGGGHAIDTGLKNLDKFSSIGAFSAAAPEADSEDLVSKYSGLFGSPPAANQLKHFWIPIGKQDFLLDRNRKFVELLTEKKVQHDFKLTDGGHSWDVWRVYLPEFLQMVVPYE